MVVSIDGLRPDAIEAYGMKTLQGLMERGSSTLEARTIFPSMTLPSHTSMLTGRTPDAHGITFNLATDGKGIVAVPTIFELAREAGLHTAAFYSKAKFRHLDRPGSYDHRQMPTRNYFGWMAGRTAGDAIRYMRHHEPNLLFIHIGEPDYAGHAIGWMGSVYGMAVRRADDALERIVDAANDTWGRDGWTLIVTADHGGSGRDHGSESEHDTRIPWLAYGPGVAPGAELSGVRTMDTAATVLWLLGVPVPAELDGRPVLDAFTDAAVAAGQ